MVDKKGALVFVIVALLLAYGFVIGTVALGLLDIGVDSMMTKVMLLAFVCTPALAALAARPFALPLPQEAPTLKAGNMRRILGMALLPFAVTVLIHVAITVFGYAQPDWGLGKVLAGIEPYLAQSGQTAEGAGGQIAAALLVLMPIVSIALGMTVYAFVALGVELGFRRFLQPRLLRAFDRPLAYTMSALALILWLAPLFVAWKIQVNADGTGIAQVRGAAPRFVLMLAALTVILGEVQRRSGSTGLAAVFLGSFFAQSSYINAGMWSSLYSQVVEPATGTFGWFSVVTWCLVAVIIYVFPSRIEAAQRVQRKEDAAKGQTGPKVRPRAEA